MLLVRHATTGTVHAMKVLEKKHLWSIHNLNEGKQLASSHCAVYSWMRQIISKKFVIDMDSVHHMKTERYVMTKVGLPFAVNGQDLRLISYLLLLN